MSFVNKKETTEAEQARFCWSGLRNVHINSSNGWRRIQSMVGGMVTRCWSSAGAQLQVGEDIPVLVRENGLLGAISLSTLVTVLLFVVFLLLLRLLFITMMLVDPGCHSAAC